MSDPPPPLVITVDSSKAFQYDKSGYPKLKLNLEKEDFNIQLDNIELSGEQLKPENLKEILAKIPNLHIDPHSTSWTPGNKTKDIENSNVKSDAVNNYIKNTIQILIEDQLKPSDEILIDDFLSKNKAKYGRLDSLTDPLTADEILNNPDNIKYLASSTETTIIGKNTGREKDADDLLGFLTAVVDSRAKFNKSLEFLKTNIKKKNDKDFFQKMKNKLAKDHLDSNKVQKYKYYKKNKEDDRIDEGVIDEGYNFDQLTNTLYLGINTSDETSYSREQSFDKKRDLIKTYADDSQVIIARIFNPEETKGGRKSRKLSKGGRRRKTRSNKFA
jgi:hypothetical protein